MGEGVGCGGCILGRRGSLSLDTCLGLRFLLVPGLRPPGVGPEYSGLLSVATPLPPLPHHQGQHFCAIIDQSGLTMIR